HRRRRVSEPCHHRRQPVEDNKIQAEGGQRERQVNGVDKYALPIYGRDDVHDRDRRRERVRGDGAGGYGRSDGRGGERERDGRDEIGRASCRERVWIGGGYGAVLKEER